MVKYKIARDIFEKCFPSNYASQHRNDWKGPILLHQDLIEYYAVFGPLNVSLPAYGNSFYLPRLVDLWKYQEGYRWHGLTKERLTDWNDEWLVVADQGADPFIFSLVTGVILFGNHGHGNWQPKKLFNNIETMVTCLATLSSIVISVSGDLIDDQGYIKEHFRQAAKKQLGAILPSPDQTHEVLLKFGWI